MNTTINRLVESFGEILASPDLGAKGKSGSIEDAAHDIAPLARMFQAMFGMPCPPSLQPGLVLADISVTWEYSGEVSGEVQLRHLPSAMHRLLDDSLLNLVVDGHQLCDMRIIDAVTDNAGPLHTLIEVGGGKVSEQLFLFDSPDLELLELRYDAYLEMAAATRGIIYWQYLFCDRGLTHSASRTLQAELAFLTSRFPAPELEMLERRLRERSE